MNIDAPTLRARLVALHPMAQTKADNGGAFSYDAGRAEGLREALLLVSEFETRRGRRVLKDSQKGDRG